MDIDGIFYCSRCMRKIEDDTHICPHCGYDSANVTVNSQHLAEGTFLNERYLLGAVIGAGGFGVTYAAWDENLSVPVALKEYFPVKYAYRNIEDSDELLPYEESRGLFALGLSRFRKEAQVLAQFQNVPGIVNINECFDENETAYIAMEFVHGVPLDEYVREHHPSPKKLLDIMLPAINALEIIHRQGINHRDIKPDNLLVQEDGSIKLIDFGSAREVEHVTNLIVVSDGYAPLEQYDLKQPQGPWVDVYGISATIYHMLTGVMPEASISRAKHDTLKAPSKLGVKLKKYQEKALMAGLTVDPQKRIQSIAEFRALLYNMPLPEEVRRRKAFVRRFISVAVLSILVLSVLVINFTHGFPLGEGLLYSLCSDGWHIVGVAEERTKVTVPEDRLGLPVTAIENNTFRDNHTIKEVIISGSVHNIGSYSFANCLGLTSLVLNEGIINISEGAFYSCVNLQVGLIPRSVESIGEYAFFNCNSITTMVAVTDGHLKNIGRYAFSDCNNLEYIILPNKLEYIGEGAFSYCTSLDYFELPGYVTSISDAMFTGCTNLKSITLRNRVTYIGNHAFRNCISLNSVEIPDSTSEIGSFAFSGCISLTSVTLPHGVTSVDANCFYGCTSLTSVTLPYGVTSVDANCFYGCTSLTSVTLPDSVAIIKEWAFYNCTSLKSITLPNSLTSIGAFAFSSCSSLSSIALPDYLENIDKGVFKDCSSLASIDIPDSVKSIGSYAFEGCDALITINLPDGLVSIGSEAFYSCDKLKSIDIPHSVTSLGDRAFLWCTSLENITLSENLTIIEDATFMNCHSLVSITVPNHITRIERQAFDNCCTLKSVVLPSSISMIGKFAFDSCHPDLIIQVQPNSYAAQYCLDNNLNYIYTDELPETQ